MRSVTAGAILGALVFGQTAALVPKLDTRESCSQNKCLKGVHKGPLSLDTTSAMTAASTDCFSFLAVTVSPCPVTTTKTVTEYSAATTVTDAITDILTTTELTETVLTTSVTSTPSITESLTETAATTIVDVVDETTTATVLTTTTVTVFPTTTVVARVRRATSVVETVQCSSTKSATSIPCYAHCGKNLAAYSSACACIGVATGVTSTAPATTTTITETVTLPVPVITTTVATQGTVTEQTTLTTATTVTVVGDETTIATETSTTSITVLTTTTSTATSSTTLVATTAVEATPIATCSTFALRVISSSTPTRNYYLDAEFQPQFRGTFVLGAVFDPVKTLQLRLDAPTRQLRFPSDTPQFGEYFVYVNSVDPRIGSEYAAFLGDTSFNAPLECARDLYTAALTCSAPGCVQRPDFSIDCSGPRRNRFFRCGENVAIALDRQAALAACDNDVEEVRIVSECLSA
ncbi:hypothetical protein MN608_11279 [Microdochium nivale]|nr:hypothetical protein MN608_11279 [Microdochium nivale]